MSNILWILFVTQCCYWGGWYMGRRWGRKHPVAPKEPTTSETIGSIYFAGREWKPLERGRNRLGQ